MTALLDLAVNLTDRAHQRVGACCDRAATLLERTAEALRWLAAATRVAP